VRSRPTFRTTHTSSSAFGGKALDANDVRAASLSTSSRGCTRSRRPQRKPARPTASDTSDGNAYCCPLLDEPDGMLIPEVADCSEGEGWTYADGGTEKIILCGEACDLVTDGSNIDAVYECPPSG
jgi:hypothetical protein